MAKKQKAYWTGCSRVMVVNPTKPTRCVMVVNYTATDGGHEEAGERFDMTLDDLKDWAKDDPTFLRQSLNW